MRLTLTLILLLFCTALYVQAQTGVQIGRVQVASVGRTVTVPVELITPSQNFHAGGFELLVKYHPTLVFQSAAAGQLLTNCAWEYFTYRGEAGNLIRLVSLAEIANGPVHPTCNGEAPGALATLEFFIPNNTTLQCQVLPLQFYWQDCGDNAFSSPDGSTLIISDNVYSWDGSNEFNITDETPFPTFKGAPAACLLDSNNTTTRAVDFHNGGVSMMAYDIEDPFATCPSNITVGNDPGSCGALVTFDAYIGDNCPGGSIVCTPPSGTFFPLGSNIVICVATDAVGRIDSCSFTIMVVDTVAPLITCHNDTTVSTTPGLCAAVVDYNVPATDLCSPTLVQSTPPSGSLFPLGNTTVISIATDTWGQTDSCSFVITVVDNEAPVVTCPDTICVNNEPGMCGSIVGYNATVSDNCFASLYCNPDSGSFFDIGQTLVLCMASDQAGNANLCSLIVIVDDNEQPAINMPGPLLRYNDSGDCSAIVTFDVTVSDNCDSVSITSNPPSGSLFPIGLSYVYCVATDASSNVYSDSFAVTIIDSQPPTLLHPDTIVVSNETGLCGSQIEFLLSATDNCGSVAIVSDPPSGSFFNLGTTHVLAVATDSYGLVDSGLIVVTIIDTETPTLSCHNDTTVMLDSGMTVQQVDWVIEATDNCANPTISSTPPPGSLFPVGLSTVVCVATDNYENTDSCLFTIEIVEPDIDSDGVTDWLDNCPTIANSDQIDTDNDGIGDACCCSQRGNVDNAIGPGGPVDVSDLTYLVSFLFGSATLPPCPEQGNVDGSNLSGVAVDVNDLTYLVAFLFQAGPVPPSCSYTSVIRKHTPYSKSGNAAGNN